MNEVIDRIHARIIEDGGCWLWPGACGGKGDQPQIKVAGKVDYVRRILYVHTKGPVHEGRKIVRQCECATCVNPEHHVAKTHSALGKQNAAAGKYSTVQRCAKIAASKRAACAKITMEQAMEIRYGSESAKALAIKFDISPSAAASIRRGERWKEYGSNPFAGLL